MKHLRCLVIFVFLLSPSAYSNSFYPLDEQIAAVKTSENISALAYGIVDDKEVLWRRAHGHHSVEERRPINMDSLFRIGSITKSFTALATLLLEQRSPFSTKTAVKEILPSPPFINEWPKHPITTEMLLEHTAGFSDMSKLEFDYPNRLSLEAAFSLNPQSRNTVWQPGLHSSYSNSGAGIVSAVIEAVSVMSFEQCLDELIFTPLGQNSATLSPPEPLYKHLVHGYDRDGETPIPYWHQLYPAFGALNISTSDMLKYAQVLLSDGRYSEKQIFPDQVIARLTQVTTGLGRTIGLEYGYAKGLYHFQRQGVTFYGHGGDADGYLSFLAFSKKINRAYFIVINAFNPPAMRRLRKLLEDFLTQGVEISLPARYQMSGSEMQMLEGEYESVTQRFPNERSASLKVYRDDKNQIFTRIGSSAPRRLLPVNANLFRRPAQSVATSALISYAGNIYLQGDFGNFRKKRPSTSSNR